MARASAVVLSYISIPGNHSIAFSNNAARDSWFDGRTKTSYTGLYYVRDTGIALPGVLDTFKAFNFGYYLNESGSRIYFRVIKLVYVNEETTVIEIEKDVLLTYLPTSTMAESYIERSNEAPSSIFDSDVPEVQYSGGFTNTLLYTMSGAYEYMFYVQVTGGFDPDDTDLFQTEVNLKSFNDDDFTISFPSKFIFFDNETDFQLLLQDYATSGTGDRILSAGVVPASDLAYSQFGGSGIQTGIIDCIRDTQAVSVSTSINPRIAKDNVTVIIAEIDNYGNQIEIPISELSSGSITIVSVSDPITQQRHYAVLSGVDGDNELKYRLTINTGSSLPAMNLPAYMAMRNIETDLGAQQTNTLLGGVSSISTNAAVGAGFGGTAGAFAGGVVGAISTGANALQNQVSAVAALEKAKRLTPTVSGNLSGIGLTANRSIGVHVFIKEPSGSGLQQMLDYYRFFGYYKSRIQVPEVKSGTKFYQGNIHGTFPGASATDHATIRELFSSGVWIWANEGVALDY